MKKIALILLFWLVVVNLFGLLALNRLNLVGDQAYNWIDPAKFFQEKTWNPVFLHAKWDSFWYLDIAQNGYSYKGVEKLSNIVFFPLYPFLIKVVSFFTLGNYILAGWLISVIFLFLSLVYLYKITKEFHSEVDPYLPIFFLLIFPAAFFLNAVYTESLFLFLSLATFYYSLKKKFFWAGVFGLLSSLSRVTGVLLFLPVLWEYLKVYNFKIKEALNRKILPLFLIPLGLFSFFIYHYLKFKNFFLFFWVEAWWGRFFNLNKEHFKFFSSSAITNFCLDAFFVAFILLIIFFVFKKLRASYGIYMLSTVAIALSSGTLMSINRYILVLFPIYIILAKIKNEYLKMSWIIISILLLALYIILFVNNYWAG